MAAEPTLDESKKKEDVRSALSQYIYLGDELECMELPPREDLKSNTRIDDIMPIFKDSLTIISAPPKSGKSLLMLHLAMNLAWCGNMVLYISLENSLRQDKERIDEALKTYNKKMASTFSYINIDRVPTKNKSTCVYKYIEYFEEYDAIFVDATEKIITLGEDGTQVSKNGKEVLDIITTAFRFTNENHPAVVCSWQYSKQNLNNKIEEASLASLGGSIAAVQMADNIWTIIRDRKENKWCVKLLASREDYNIENTTFSAINKDTKRFDIYDEDKEFIDEYFNK